MIVSTYGKMPFQGIKLIECVFLIADTSIPTGNHCKKPFSVFYNRSNKVQGYLRADEQRKRLCENFKKCSRGTRRNLIYSSTYILLINTTLVKD